MAWTVQESWQNTQTGVTIEKDGIKASADVTRVFSAVPSTVGATTNDALAAPGIPLSNSAHPQNPAFRARRFNVSQSGPMYFEITVGYEASTNDPNDPSQNPLNQPAVVTFGSVTQEVEADFDIDGDPIQTINDEPIAGVTRPFTDLTITVQRNLPSFSPASISTYMNKVNSAVWYGLPAGTVRIMDISARNVFSNDFAYWDVSIAFQVRRGAGPVTDAKAWWFRTAHQGYTIKNGAGDKREIAHADPAHDFTTDDAIKKIRITVAQPVMIHLTTGVRLAAGVAAFIEFEVLDEIDFNNLNLL